MTILGNKSFADRLNATKSVFQKALKDAEALKLEMTAKVVEKNKQIEAINAEIADINLVSSEADRFISNLERLV